MTGPRVYGVGGVGGVGGGAGRGERVLVDVRVADGRVVGTVGGEPVDAHVERAGSREVVLRLPGRTVRALVVAEGRDVLVAIDGRSYRLATADAGAAEGTASAVAAPFATSPMTGLVTKVAVAPGDAVAPGAVLFVVEAMKMEYVVRAEGEALVAEVRRRAGDRVSQGEVVVAYRDGAAAGAGGEA